MSAFDRERIKDIAEFLEKHRHCDRCGRAIVSEKTLCNACCGIVMESITQDKTRKEGEK